MTKVIKTDLIKTVCPRTDKSGYLVRYGKGRERLFNDEPAALAFYKGTDGRKEFCICECGYEIPVFSA